MGDRLGPPRRLVLPYNLYSSRCPSFGNHEPLLGHVQLLARRPHVGITSGRGSPISCSPSRKEALGGFPNCYSGPTWVAHPSLKWRLPQAHSESTCGSSLHASTTGGTTTTDEKWIDVDAYACQSTGVGVGPQAEWRAFGFLAPNHLQLFANVSPMTPAWRNCRISVTSSPISSRTSSLCSPSVGAEERSQRSTRPNRNGSPGSS